MRRIEGLIFIFIVVSLVGISIFWTHTTRRNGVTPTLERLIEAGYTIEEILQHPEAARLNRRYPGLFPKLDDWTEDDLRHAREQIETRSPESAAKNIGIEALRRLEDHFKKSKAVKKLIFAALETHSEGSEPFTIENSLPAPVRAEIEEAFGDDANAVLSRIEEAFATRDSSTRVVEPHGGVNGYLDHLLESLSAPAGE
ncbi:MAG: hypothetical protein OXN17_18820 [Candidatus Poribacteria bacterium]|nr:hypothetical protein [Candidatus Poribacteria bacterium]MDE0506057.1 hypothetical protein [Candidatus Poribacteria bacterium]